MLPSRPPRCAAFVPPLLLAAPDPLVAVLPPVHAPCVTIAALRPFTATSASHRIGSTGNEALRRAAWRGRRRQSSRRREGSSGGRGTGRGARGWWGCGSSVVRRERGR
ncbi:hypothetical protein C8R45DRAFT_1028439 [Mycena sanguinolenta]|nr:hypothetical protein C8R45DRAFT_1028439 [Mycena sanguinolenta]